MYHTPSHMDDYLEADDLDTASIYNIMADKLADEYYHPDQPTVDNADLTQYLFGSFYHDSFPITVPFRKWAHQQVSITRSRRHYTTNYPLALRDIEIDWACMKSVAKRHHCLWQRKQSMKLIWELYAYQNLKLLRGQCKPSEANCMFCGSHIETQEHVLHECDHQTVNVHDDIGVWGKPPDSLPG